MNNDVLVSWTKGDDQKAVWLKTDKYTIGLEIETAFDSAFVSVRHNTTNPDAHNLAIGLNKEGRSFLQVSDGDNVKIVDLFKVISFISDLMNKNGASDELDFKP